MADSLSIALDGRINLRVLARHPEVTNPNTRAVLARLVSHANARSALASLTVEPAPCLAPKVHENPGPVKSGTYFD